MSVNLNAPQSPAIVYAEAYDLIAAVRALGKTNGFCAEYGAQARLENMARQKAHELGIEFSTLCMKYDAHVRVLEETAVLARIKAGQIDQAVINPAEPLTQGVVNRPTAERSVMYMDKDLEPGRYAVYPVDSAPAPKQPTTAVLTVEQGQITSIRFALRHGLPDGEYGLVKGA